MRERDRDLELRVAKMADELAAVEGQQRTRQDARAEAELRHAVGEYTEAQWATVAHESDAELATLEARRVECAREHQAAYALLASVRRSAVTPVAGSPRVTPSAGAPVAPAAPVVTSTQSGAHIKTPASDELAFLSSLAADVERRSGTSKAITTEQVADAASAPLRPSRPVAPAPAPLPAVAAPTLRASRPVRAEAAPVSDQRRTTIPVPLPDALPDTMPDAISDAMPESAVPPEHAALTDADVNVPRGSHNFATPVAEPRQTSPRVNSRDSASILRRAQTDHVKSLKCAECGTLNLPTEWYCEKCGAELSAL